MKNRRSLGQISLLLTIYSASNTDIFLNLWIIQHGMKYILFTLFAALLLVNCSKNDSAQPTPPDNSGLMPLKTGNSWSYTKVNFDSAGNRKDSSYDEIDIVSSTTINNVGYYFQVQHSIFINGNSFFLNTDSNTVSKIDSATQYIFFKRITSGDSTLVDSWKDTVTSRCTGKNYLYAFSGSYTINSHTCLKNMVLVNDCTGSSFEKWVYYLQPHLGLVRIEHYVTDVHGNFYLQFSEDLKNYSI